MLDAWFLSNVPLRRCSWIRDRNVNLPFFKPEIWCSIESSNFYLLPRIISLYQVIQLSIERLEKLLCGTRKMLCAYLQFNSEPIWLVVLWKLWGCNNVWQYEYFNWSRECSATTQSPLDSGKGPSQCYSIRWLSSSSLKLITKVLEIIRRYCTHQLKRKVPTKAEIRCFIHLTTKEWGTDSNSTATS